MSLAYKKVAGMENNRENPIITFFVTSYNRPEYLDEALSSLHNQTVNNWEAVITDRCSDDPRVRDVIIKWCEEDPRFMPFFLRKVGRNLPSDIMLAIKTHQKAMTMLGFKQPRYYSFLDDDNRKAYTFCEVMLDLIAQTETDMAVCASTTIDAGGHLIGIKNQKDGTYLSYGDLLKTNIIDWGEIVISYDLFHEINELDQDIPAYIDWILALKVLQLGYKISSTQAILHDYRVHPGQLTARHSRRIPMWIDEVKRKYGKSSTN